MTVYDEHALAGLAACTMEELTDLIAEAGDTTDMAEIEAAVEAELARRDRAAARAQALASAQAVNAADLEAWRLAAHADYLQAEEDCRGELVNTAGVMAGVPDGFALWRGPRRQAERYATEELRDWWDAHGRLSPGDFRAQQAAMRRDARDDAAALAEAGYDDIPAWDTVQDTEETCDEQQDEHAASLVGIDAPERLRRVGAADTVRPDRDRQQLPDPPARPVRDTGPVHQPARGTVISYADPRMRPLKRIDLWRGRIPCGDVTLVYGEGAAGKGRMICDLIGRVTTGRPMPLCPPGTAMEPGSVIVIQPEDDPNEQVAHRLRAAGADLSRVYDLTRLEGGSRFKLSARIGVEGHLPHLRQVIDTLEAEGRNPRMVVIDPLAAVVGWGTINTNPGARALMEPLQDLAKDTGVAILVVAHTVKSGALQGSAGLPQALRTVWKVSRDKDNPAFRQLELTKANNLPDTEPVRYTITEDDDGRIRVVWQDRAQQLDQRMAWREKLEASQARRGGVPGVTYTAVFGSSSGSRIIARGITSLDTAKTVCARAPEARALEQAGTPLTWTPSGKPGQWKAGLADYGFAIITQPAQQQQAS